MMADLKSIELSSFTFDIMLNYSFLVVYLLVMSQSQSRTLYDVTTILYYTTRAYHIWYTIIAHRTRSSVHVVHVATMYVYNAVHGKYMYYDTRMGHVCMH